MPKSIRLPGTPSDGPQTGQTEWSPFLPTIDDEEPLRDVVSKLSQLVPILSLYCQRQSCLPLQQPLVETLHFNTAFLEMHEWSISWMVVITCSGT